jgi:hypothetical protein
MATSASGQAAEPFWKDSQDRDAAASLEELGTQLDARGYQAQLVTPPGRRPRLQVRNPDVPMLAEDIYAESGWYWYAFAERIAPAADPATAAAKIARVLHAAGAR